MLKDGHRATCELAVQGPSLFLSEVECERNPHHFGHRAQCCWYSCDEWFVYDQPSQWEMVVDSKHQRGDRVILYTTASCMHQEPWGQNPPNMFIFWQNRFRRIHKIGWRDPWNRHGYPLVDRPQRPDSDSDEECRPSYKDEQEDESKPFMRAILKQPEDRTTYLVFADWLAERDIAFHEYIRAVMPVLDGVKIAAGVDARLMHYYRLRPSNTRTAIYTLVNLFQNAQSLYKYGRDSKPSPRLTPAIGGIMGESNTGKVVECQGFYSHPLIMGYPLRDDE